MRLPERAAKAIIEVVLRGAEMRYVASQAHGEHDFDLYHGGAEPAAVEVTSSADSRHLATIAALGDARRGGQFVPAKQCRRSWYVHPVEGADIRRIRARVDEYLAAIESEGLESFHFATVAQDSNAVTRIGRDLRIEDGQIFAWKDGPQIGIAAPGRGGFIDPGSISAALEAEAVKDDNVRKLQRSGRAHRHLVVWVDSSNHHAWGPLAMGMPPAGTPALPSAVTHAWVLSSAGAMHRFRALQFTARNGWIDHGVVEAEVSPGP